MKENFSKAFEGYFQWIIRAGEISNKKISNYHLNIHCLLAVYRLSSLHIYTYIYLESFSYYFRLLFPPFRYLLYIYIHHLIASKIEIFTCLAKSWLPQPMQTLAYVTLSLSWLVWSRFFIYRWQWKVCTLILPRQILSVHRPTNFEFPTYFSINHSVWVF